MKVLIQRRRTGRYFSKPGHGTVPNKDDAHVYNSANQECLERVLSCSKACHRFINVTDMEKYNEPSTK